MRKLSLLIILAAASFPLAAQQHDERSAGTEQQQTRRGQTSQGADSNVNGTVAERARTEGAAGGTAPVPKEKRKAVGAGAGPHLHDQRPGRTQELPHDKPVEPSR